MKKAEGKNDLKEGKKSDINQVDYDKNWRLSIATELKSAEVWKEDWGFLVTIHSGIINI